MKRKIMYSTTAVALLLLTACTNENKEPVNEPTVEVKPATTEPIEIEETEIIPLTKDEVLAKFPVDPDIEPYIDGQFIFVGNRTDTADYYALADTERYRNLSVIFKDSEIASIKFIPEGDTDPAELLAEFGITDEPREGSNRVFKTYEVALIPLYWSQNIERYPFELD